MTDLLQRLQHARPTGADLDRIWPPDERAIVLERIGADALPPRTPSRRAWLGAAAVAVALVVVPSIVDGGGAAAQADLRNLAVAAVSAEGPVIAQGTYLHVKTEAIQRNSSVFGDGRRLDTNRESWVRWDGTTWAIDTRPSAGWREYHVFPRPEEPTLNLPTPEFAASLPGDPDALRAYLDAHVTGSNSHAKAIFVAITDLARSHFLPPKTLGAALEVLAAVDGVQTREVTALGRPAVEITYTEFWSGLTGRHAVILDRATARVISEHDSDPGGGYDLTTTLIEVVREIPGDVANRFQQVGNGERVYGAAPSPRASRARTGH